MVDHCLADRLTFIQLIFTYLAGWPLIASPYYLAVDLYLAKYGVNLPADLCLPFGKLSPSWQDNLCLADLYYLYLAECGGSWQVDLPS